MKKRIRLTDKDKVNIVTAYSTGLVPMIELAKQYGITRQGIYKVIVAAGVERTEVYDTSCVTCGKVFKRHRAQLRKNLHNFCGPDCYHAWLAAGNGSPFIQNKHSCRLAREIVWKHFNLRPEHIVHHKDRNQYNNDLANLAVFACNGDHVSHHRGGGVRPIWDGAIDANNGPVRRTRT